MSAFDFTSGRMTTNNTRPASFDLIKVMADFMAAWQPPRWKKITCGVNVPDYFDPPPPFGLPKPPNPLGNLAGMPCEVSPLIAPWGALLHPAKEGDKTLWCPDVRNGQCYEWSPQA